MYSQVVLFLRIHIFRECKEDTVSLLIYFISTMPASVSSDHVLGADGFVDSTLPSFGG